MSDKITIQVKKPKPVKVIVNPPPVVKVLVKARLVGTIGPQGPEGETGPAGPQGDQGPQGESAAASYTFTQGLPSAVWTINHSLGFFPNVTVIDSSDAKVEGDIQYVDANNIVITFSAAFSGKAYAS